MHIHSVTCQICQKSFEVAYIRPLPKVADSTVCITCASSGKASRRQTDETPKREYVAICKAEKTARGNL